MKAIVLLLFAITISACTKPDGRFMGEIELFPAGCEASQTVVCKLKNPIAYYSSRSSSEVWNAPAFADQGPFVGTTDGASIPPLAQFLVGEPYDPLVIKAAAIHDHFTMEWNRQRPWLETHEIFLDAMLASGVNELKAYTMYAAVLVLGKKWDHREFGEFHIIKADKGAPISTPDSSRAFR
jgi:hypothetical protein